MEVVIDQKGEETVIKIKGRLDTNTAQPSHLFCVFYLEESVKSRQTKGLTNHIPHTDQT